MSTHADERIFNGCKPKPPSYLLHGSDTGTGTSRRCPAPRRSPRRWADTGLCCPIWACRPPPPSPSSPGRRERGCDHPAPGWESSTCASWRLAVFLETEMFALRRCRERAEKLPLQPPLALSFTPAEQPRKRGWDIYSDLWYRSYQPLVTASFVLSDVSHLKEVWPCESS